MIWWSVFRTVKDVWGCCGLLSVSTSLDTPSAPPSGFWSFAFCPLLGLIVRLLCTVSWMVCGQENSSEAQHQPPCAEEQRPESDVGQVSAADAAVGPTAPSLQHKGSSYASSLRAFLCSSSSPPPSEPSSAPLLHLLPQSLPLLHFFVDVLVRVNVKIRRRRVRVRAC